MTTESLHRLVYFSRNFIPGKPAEIAVEIESILESARRNNAQRSVVAEVSEPAERRSSTICISSSLT